MDSSNFTPEVITLDFYSKSGDSFGVTWQTKEEGKPILEYTDEDDLNFEHPVRVKGECSEGMKAKKNCAVITGIAPGQRCRWRVGDECGVRSADAVFTVPPTGGDKLLCSPIHRTKITTDFGGSARVKTRSDIFPVLVFSRTRAI